MQKSNKFIERDGKQGVQSFGAFGQKDPKESFGLPFLPLDDSKGSKSKFLFS